MIFAKQILLNCAQNLCVAENTSALNHKPVDFVDSPSFVYFISYVYSNVDSKWHFFSPVSGSKYFHFIAQVLSVVRYDVLMWFLLTVALSTCSAERLMLNALNAGVCSLLRSRFSTRDGGGVTAQSTNLPAVTTPRDWGWTWLFPWPNDPAISRQLRWTNRNHRLRSEFINCESVTSRKENIEAEQGSAAWFFFSLTMAAEHKSDNETLPLRTPPPTSQEGVCKWDLDPNQIPKPVR